MAKMMDVPPETWLQGIGQYSEPDLTQSLGWIGATADEVLMGLRGVGTLSQVGGKVSVMDAIVANAREMNAKMNMVEKARQEAAAKSPTIAVALAKKEAQTSMPGANEAKGVKEALNVAAKKALEAKKNEAEAKRLLMQSDKRGAAAKAVNALTLAREAAIVANKAEKTRLARSLDILAQTLTAQADYIDSMVKTQIRHSGDNARTMALAATAQSLREQVKRLKAQSAAVAALPDVPSAAPTPQRIADLANKFNIRTAGERKFEMNQAVISVLGDLAENPLAQVKDYAGAYSYYGQDAAGKMMADMEFGNKMSAIKGLASFVHGMGYADTGAILRQADGMVAAGQRLAQQAYAGAVSKAANLGGLSRIPETQVNPAWDRWCDNKAGVEYPAEMKNACREGNRGEPWGADLVEPWSVVGKNRRGLPINWTAAVTNLFKPQPATPPAQTAPPTQVAPQPQPATGGGLTNYFTPPSFMQPAPGKSNTMLYVGIGAGVLALGGAAWYFMRPRAA